MFKANFKHSTVIAGYSNVARDWQAEFIFYTNLFSAAGLNFANVLFFKYLCILLTQQCPALRQGIV
jgi:hypothetical protein